MLDGNGTYGTVRTRFERRINAYIEEIACVVFVIQLRVYCSGFARVFLERRGVSVTHPMKKWSIVLRQREVECERLLPKSKVVCRVLGRE